jgi:cytochrome c-type biogenesis protein CcmH
MNTRALKRWPGWVLLVIVVAGFLAVGATRDSGPSTPAERAASIEKRLACPTCDGESVYDSRSTAAENLRRQIRAYVDEGELTDEEIIGTIEQAFGARVLLVPRATGLDALAWALPAAALVCAAAGLTVTFRRWRREAALAQGPTDEDRELVAAALSQEDAAPPADPAP